MRHVATFASELLGPEGAALFAWSPTDGMLAVAAARRKAVVLFGRDGGVVTALTVPDPASEFLYNEAAECAVAALAWHPSGSQLAVLPRGQSFAVVWSVGSGLARVESGVEQAEVTAMAWNPAAPQLALGTARGTGVAYDCATLTATPLALGRAAKPVCCMAWSADAVPGGLLALGCRGGLLQLCRPASGALEGSAQLKGAVSQLQFCKRGGGDGPAGPAAEPKGGALLAANVGKRSICVWEMPQALGGGAAGSHRGGSIAGAFELTFRESYGALEHFTWVHPRLLAAGFSSGQLAAVSLTGGLQPGTGAGVERFSARCLQAAVAGLAWCPATDTLATGGGCQLAVLRCRGQEVELEADASTLELDAGQHLAALQFAPGGSHLTAASSGGRLLNLLVRPPLLHGAWAGRVAYVDHGSSTGQALIVATDPADVAETLALPLPACQPELLALGPGHVAVACGGQVWVQGIDADPATGRPPPPCEYQFPAAIAWLALNAHCLLLLGEGGHVFVQALDAGAGSIVELSGDDGEPFAAGCAALTERHILLGMPSGVLAFYDAADCCLLSEYRHSGGAITAAYPNADGSMVLFQDAAGGLFLYDAAEGELMQPPDFAGSLAAAAWDGGDPRVVAALSSTGTVYVYCVIPASVQGPGVKLVGTHAAPARAAAPLALHAGLLAWHMPSGALHAQLLSTHQHLAAAADGGSRQAARSGSGTLQAQAQAQAQAAAAGMSREGRLAAACNQALALCQFDAALAAARQLGDAQLLREVAAASLQFFDLPAAVAAYEVAGDEAALAQLRPLVGERDGNLLAGHIVALTGGDPERAEQLLLASSRPSAAIEVLHGLGHWERALQLAEHLQPDAVGALALLRAQALEKEGQVKAAAAAYRQALSAPDPAATNGLAGAAAWRAECQAGLARCCILSGDEEGGMELAAAAGSPDLLLQRAALLEGERQLKHAGQLYAQAGQWERAAQLFLAAREFGLLDGVMERAGSPSMWLQYAQAKEDLGSFADAAHAFEKAGDVAAAVRVLLERLRDAEAAAELAQRSGSAAASQVVARHAERSGKAQLAMEHYCLAGECQAAFLLAKRAGCMEAFAARARQERDAPAALLAAEHFEAQGALAVAGELCAIAGRHERAARLYIQAGGDSLSAAVRLAGESHDAAAAAVVLAHLEAVDSMGAALQDLHLALGHAEQACAVAAARAQQEQAAGNYKASWGAARDVLLRACLDLQQRGAPATPALLSALRLVHSYLLVRLRVRQGDHVGAARLLLVVADGIHAFPKHVVPILTSAVRWAEVLMQPQLVGQVAPGFAKKVEAISRQPAWTTERTAAEEPHCDCLFCGTPGPESALACAACHRGLPFCAASGRRMMLGDWSACPSCSFPCRGRDLAHFAGAEGCCPLCEAPLAPQDVTKVFDPISHLRRTAFAGLV